MAKCTYQPDWFAHVNRPQRPKVVAIDTPGHREPVRARRDVLVNSHTSLVEGIARAVARSLPVCFDLDDLIGVGNVALLRAATRWRPGTCSCAPGVSCAHEGVPFAAYARQSIRGAIIDSVRRKNWTEATRPSITPISRSHATGEPAQTEGNRAAEAAATVPTVEQDIDARRLAKRLHAAIAELPRDQRRVLEMYYGAAAPTLAVVAGRLAVSPGRASQLRIAAVEGLRARLSKTA